MLVRALLLRHLGVKIDAARLRATQPIVGLLTLDRSLYGGRDGRGRDVCRVMPVGPGCTPHVELLSARLIRIEKRGLLIVGEEDQWNRKRRTTYPQALWAWPFEGKAQPARPPLPAYDARAEEFLAQLADIT